MRNAAYVGLAIVGLWTGTKLYKDSNACCIWHYYQGFSQSEAPMGPVERLLASVALAQRKHS